jgi:uncharacterized membrane protein
MKKVGFTPYPLQGYWGKIFGFVLSIIALIVAVLNHFYDFHIIHNADKNDHTIWFLWFFGFGLYMMMMSKEKKEDERIKKIRAKSMQIFIAATLTPVLTIGMFAPIDRTFQMFNTSTVQIILILGLIIYNIYFNYSVRFDPKWNYNDGGAVDNLKSSPKIFWLILATAILLPLLFLLK